MSRLPSIVKYFAVGLVFALVTTLVLFNIQPELRMEAQQASAQQLSPAPSAAVSVRPASFADLVEKLSPAVVNISTKQTVATGGVQMFGFPFRGQPGMEPFEELFRQFEQQQQPRQKEVTSLGSGFVVSSDGYIITNNHVIAKADQITVRFNDDTELEAKVVGTDPKTDLALMKVDSKKSLPYVVLGDSDKARVGDWVIAIGNPFGLGGTVTTGIISARQRSINAGPYDDFIQTDAAINRGNSGGPLFNTNGEVIGINSAIFSPTGGNVGIGFSIPTSLAKPIIDQLKEHGKAHRGWLGVKIQVVNDEVANSVGLPKKMGALVVEVNKDGPAEKAGIQAGDIITHFNGQEIEEMRFLPRKVAESKIGAKATITVWRGGASKQLNLIVAELEEGEQEAAANDNPDKPMDEKDAQTIVGLKLVTLNDSLRRELSLSDKVNGVVIVGVDGTSEAAKRGLRRGDVLVEVNNSAVTDVTRFKRLLDDAKKAGRNFALLRVIRGKQAAFVTLPLK